MEKKQRSIEQVFSHIKASRNDIQYWNDAMIVDWLLEQEDRYKAMHKEESELLFECGRNFQLKGEGTFNEVYNETFGGNNE